MAHLREALEEARGRDGDLRAQLQAARVTLEEASSRLQQVDGELQQSRQHAEALQVCALHSAWEVGRQYPAVPSGRV